VREGDRSRRPRIRAEVWCWIALWACVLALFWSLLRAEARLERLDKRMRETPTVIYDWGLPKEDDDARHRLDKSDER
jgi:hypothetical protein